MSLPVTPEDFRLIGQRFASEDIVAEIDRLLPLARTDLPGLGDYEYGAEDLAELEEYRAKLHGESSDRRLTRGQKKGSRRTEINAVVEGKRLLRVGHSVAARAIRRRTPASGETPEETRRIADTFEAELQSVSGRIQLDSVKLRIHLHSLITILGAKELAPKPAMAPARAKLLASLTSTADRLPSLAEIKKGLQATSRADTGDLDEIDGRAYQNLKEL